jgi:hypothetical protein
MPNQHVGIKRRDRRFANLSGGKLMYLRILGSALLLASTSVSAQVTFAPPPAAPIAAPVTSNAILRTGTPVPLRLSEELTTKGKKLRVGQRFRMEVGENVIVQGVTVIPVGSPAVGEITDVRNKGMWGKSGHLGARILYVTVNGRQIRLSGAFDDKGVAGGIGAAAVSALVFLPAGFFMTGTSAKIPVGAMVKGFVDEDVQLNIAAAALPPLTVGTASAPMTVAATATAAAAPIDLGGGVMLVPAQTPSGQCIQAPAGYVGTGSQSRPAVSTERPLCG